MSNNKKPRFSFASLMQSRKFLIIVSAILAVSVWWSVMSAAVTTRDRSLTVPYTVDLSGSFADQIGLRLVEDVDVDVTVVVDGPWSVVSKLTPDDLRVRADISTVQKSGRHKVSLSVSRNSEVVDYDIVSTYPATVEINCDYWASRSFQLETDISALSVTDAATMKLGAPVLDTAAEAGVILSGPKTEMDKIAKLVAVVEQNAVLSDVGSFTAAIKAFDADGNPVEYEHCTFDRLSDHTVPLTVPVHVEATVTLGYDLAHVPVAYAEKSVVTLSPDKLKLTGTAASLAAMDESLSIGTLDFDVLRPDDSGSCVYPTSVTLPDGVTAEGASKVDVTATVLSGLTTKQITFRATGSNTTFRDLASTQKASLTQKTYTVTLVGTEKALEDITAEDLTAAVSLGTTETGRINGTLRFTVTGADDVWVYYGNAGGLTVTANVSDN